MKRPRILLEGRPGSGKTTVARRLVVLLREAEVPVYGFITEEIRQGGRRVGFLIEELGGERQVLAHESIPGPPRVGRYGLDLAALEGVALPALRRSLPAKGVLVVDELGKMELTSTSLQTAFLKVLEGPAAVVATVHRHRHPVTDELKARRDVELIEVTAANRDALPDRLAAFLLEGS